MKFYSETLDKVFETEKECLKAERDFALEQKKKEEERKTQEEKAKEEKALISKQKKECADKIAKAEEELRIAQENYKVAQDKAAQILEESNKQVTDLLNTAQEEIKKAQRAKRDAIVEFSNKFGAYTKSYTGEKAIEEFNKALDTLNPFTDFLKNFWLF